MREKIADYLAKAGRPLPAEQILREVLNILSPNSFAADKVLKGFLGADPRFHRSHSLWHLAADAAPCPTETAALNLQWDPGHPRCFQGAVHLPASGATWEFLRTEATAAADLRSLEEARQRAEDHLLLVWSRKELRLWNQLLRSAGLPEWEGESLDLSRLAARALSRESPCRHAEDLAPLLDLAPPDTEKPAAMARFLAESFRG